ncbi:bromodomain adjacent to zinc finger domain protein 1A isoform X2 [Ascaphus truei]|uniref:bromodomain adjacent to zinc finger domain protein 1A isoform X2 n=1 Tax=Ascaphus truei TaxID=8439 RepID=UPI003F5A2E4E
MPLLHRKPFIRHRPPPDLQPSERVFHCRVTNEIFRDYDEFFERTILCNSLVWSCSFTGKSGLTYQEALESEKTVRRSLQSFPEPLIVPVLYLSTLVSRQRIHELCEDIFAYVKDRFFVGETVDVVRNNGARKKKEAIHPSLFKYKVKPIKKELYESVTVKSSQLSRKPALFSRDRLKLFLRLHCEPQDGIIKPMGSSVAKYNISDKNFLHYFPDEPPNFLLLQANRGQTGRPSTNQHLNRGNGLSSKQLQSRSTKEREKILKQRNELKAMEMEKATMRRDRAQEIKSKRREKQDKERKKEELKKIVEVERLKKKEEKERIKLEKEKEREKLREEKRKYAERLKLWSKPRDDMECDDLKELPEPTPVKTRLPPECFGNTIMVLEFLHAFGELFDLKDEFPEGVTFEVLEEALVGTDTEGPLCELLFFFLTAIFQAMAEEEEEVAKDQIMEAEAKDLTEALDEDIDPTKSVLSAVASLAAAWPPLHQGCSLKDLNLDSCTLSEILRLHILASGADVTSANAKYRYQKQGGFDATDDACMELRLSNPALLKKLSSTSVYTLLPGEKLKILHALCGKLLTLVSTRDFIEDSVEELRQAKQEFRELKAEQNRREREEAAARIRKRREEKLKEQELKIKDKQEKLKEDENRGSARGAGNEDQDDLDTSSENKDVEQREQDTATEDEEEATAVSTGKGTEGQQDFKGVKNRDPHAEGSLEKKEPLTAEEEEALREEQQKREQELVLKIQGVTACTNIFPLGRDRWYRRFWTFFSVPGLFVEEDYSNLTEDLLQPRPAPQQETSHNPALSGHESSNSSVQETNEEMHLPKPVKKPSRWCYYSSPEQLNELIEALNTRGHRESSLKEALVQEKGKICLKLSNHSANRFHISGNAPPSDVKPGRGRSQNVPDALRTSAEKQLELRLCDMLLDIEDRIYQGTLGTIKVPDRQSWRAVLETFSYELLSDETKENGVIKPVNHNAEEMEIDSTLRQSTKYRLHGLKNDTPSTASTSTSTPQPANSAVRYLARALLQIEIGVERKFMKVPLGDAEDTKRDQKTDKKKKEDKKKKDEDQTSERDDASDSGRVQRTVLERWRESLLSSGSLSQIFLHLSTLDRSILWSRSILNARCKLCRKKGDGESMLLCDGCDRGHHIYCVRPKLKFVPDGDWFCQECRPKQRSRRLSPRPRTSIISYLEEEEEEEEEEVAEEEEEQEQSESEEEEQTVSEEESPPKSGKAKVKQPLKIRGRVGGRPGLRQDVGRSSRSQQGTPKNIWPVSKGSGPSTGRKTRSAPPLENKLASRLYSRNLQTSAASSDKSLVELVTPQEKGRWKGRRGGLGKLHKSTENTPESSPFAFRPFSLETAERVSQGRSQSQNVLPVQTDPKGKGKKRRSAEMSSLEQGSRRSSGRHHGVHELSACEQLVVELVRHDDSWPFMKLVSKVQVPDYYDIIQKPIALNIIREKVNKCEYKLASEFTEDIELMLSNCFEYNHLNSNEAKAGLRLQSFFINEAQKLGLDVCNSKGAHASASKRSRL